METPSEKAARTQDLAARRAELLKDHSARKTDTIRRGAEQAEIAKARRAKALNPKPTTPPTSEEAKAAAALNEQIAAKRAKNNEEKAKVQAAAAAAVAANPPQVSASPGPDVLKKAQK